eukprot:scaffold41802_cov42-Phaeocystis_antarctica.AAC.2
MYLALALLLLIQRDVGHLLAWVEERVLGRFGHDVLRGADEDRQHERRGAWLGIGSRGQGQVG